MRNVLRQLSALWLLGLLACSVSAQPAAKPADDKSKAPTLDGIIAMEDATARITALQQFLKANPTGDKTVSAREALVASYAQLGENQLNDNNVEKAVAAFQRAFKALPKQVSDRFFDETVSRIPMAVAARGYRAEAVGLGKALETRFAGEPARLATIGEFYLTIEAAGEAIAALEAAAKLAPEDARLHRALGAAYRMGLRIDDAIASYQLAVRYDARDRRAFYDLANLYRSQGAFDDAIKLYRRQLDIEPKHAPSLKGLALALTALGRDDEAAAELNKARDLRGAAEEITQDLLLQTQLAFYYLEQNKLRQARQASDAALLIEPRFSWARIAAAEVELAAGKFFEAERHLLAAQKLADFPTLAFTLGKLYLVVEDFDGAAEQFAKSFRYSTKDKFTTRLGGVRDAQSDDLRELLAPEHQAAIFLAEAPTSDELFHIAESLVRVNAKLAEAEDAKPAVKPAAKKDDSPSSLEASAQAFVQAENTRRSFRALFMATRLAQAGSALPLAIQLAEQALELAEVATEAEGSVRDYPNYDRAGRLHTFRGRAHDARGWALFKSNRFKDAVFALSQAVNEYGNLPEAKRALWHLATAHEAAGAQPLALELYLAAYEPPAANAKIDIQRTVIETIYRKVNGSLDGLAAALGQPLKQRANEDIATTARTAPALPVAVATNAPPVPAESVALAPVESKPTASPPKSPLDSIVARPLKGAPATVVTIQPLATKPAASTAPGPPEKEPVRVGLFSIPVNARNAARPTNKPAPVIPLPAPKSEPIKAAPNVEVAVKAPPVIEKESVKTEAKEVAVKSEPPPVAEVAKEPVAEIKKAVTPSETKPAEATIIITSQTVTVIPATPIAPLEAPKAETPKPETTDALPVVKEAAPVVETPQPAKVLPAPVVLPELDTRALSVVVAPSRLNEPPLSLTWIDSEEAPAPPAPVVPKPALSAATAATNAATQASTEPAVTVRYDDLPVKSAPTGDSGHAIAPTVSTRPRRVPQPPVTQANEAKPESVAPANTRQRRVNPAPTKP